MRKIISLLLILSIAVCIAGCNRTIFDTVYHFDRAVVLLPNGETICGDVDTWCDYDGDQLQIVIDGTVYLVHSSNAVLIAD